MANQIERDAFVKIDVLKNPIPYTRGTDLLPIVIHFRDFQIPSGATARVFVAKSDGNAVYTTATIDGNDVTVDVTEQMFIELGTALMQISIMDRDEELCTFVQPVNVEPNLKAGDFPASGNDITFLDDAIAQANQAVNTATTAAQQAAAAVQNANTAITNANKAISDLNEQIATLDSNFASLAQTVSISQLQTVAKNLVGAVNELNSNKLTIELFNGSALDIDLPGFYVYIIQKTKISNLVDKSVSAALGAWCIVANVTSAGTGSQFITSIDNTSQVFKRTFAANVWSAWNNNMPAASGEYNGDCNDIVQPGFFSKVITQSSGHSPGFYAYILVLKYTNTQGTETNFTQVAFPYNSANPIKTRYRAAGTWSEWA